MNKHFKLFFYIVLISIFAYTNNANAASYLGETIPDNELRLLVLKGIRYQEHNELLTEDDITPEMLNNLELSLQVYSEPDDPFTYKIKSFQGIEKVNKIVEVFIEKGSIEALEKVDLSSLLKANVKRINLYDNYNVVDYGRFFKELYDRNNNLYNTSGSPSIKYYKTNIDINLNEDNYTKFEIPINEFDVRFLDSSQPKLSTLPETVTFNYDGSNYIEYKVSQVGDNIVLELVGDSVDYSVLQNKSCLAPEYNEIFGEGDSYTNLNEKACGDDLYSSLNIFYLSFEGISFAPGEIWLDTYAPFGINVYFKNKAKPITIYYRDNTTSEEIIASEIITGNIGDEYSLSQKKVDGYTFVRQEGEITGTLDNEEKTITFFYDKDKETEDITPNKDDKKATGEDDSNNSKDKLPSTGNYYLPLTFIMTAISISVLLYKRRFFNH